MAQLGTSAEFFAQQQLFTFQLFDAPLIAGDKGLALALHDAIQKGFDLHVDLGEAVLNLRPDIFASGSSALREGAQLFNS